MNSVKELRYVQKDQLGGLGEPVAVGGGAVVYRSTLDGVPVAVRQPRITSAAALQRFQTQVELQHRMTVEARSRAWIHLGGKQVSVPVGLLPLLAVCEAPPFYCTVTPWFADGSLFDALHRSHDSRNWDLVQRLNWALQLAVGLESLHELGIVHRDIKTANVLLDGDRVALADFELSETLDSLSRTSAQKQQSGNTRDWASTDGPTRAQAGANVEPSAGPSAGRLAHMVGTTVYLAPELLSAVRSGWTFTYESDVYAFGITLNEIISGCVPYVDRRLSEPELHTVLETRFNELQLRTAIVTEHLRPSLDIDALEHSGGKRLGELIQQCWDHDPSKRPSMAQVVQHLTEIHDALRDGRVTGLTEARKVRPGLHPDPSCQVGREAITLRADAFAASAGKPTVVEIRQGHENAFAIANGLVEPAALLSSYFNEDSSRMALLARTLTGWYAKNRHQKPGMVTIAPAGFRQRSNWCTNPSGSEWRLEAEAFAVPGCRGSDRMEDRHFIECSVQVPAGWSKPSPDGKDMPVLHLLGVFDGHGSDAVADFAALVLPEAFRQLLGNASTASIQGMLRDALCITDVSWMQWCSEFTDQRNTQNGLVGSTALLAALHGSSLYLANVGDSRAVLYEERPNSSLEPVLITRDQNCTSAPMEIERLRHRGARLVPTGGALRVEGLVLVTRAIGDIALKQYLTADPELYQHQLRPNRSYVLVLATDGLWDVASNDDVAELIQRTVKLPGLLARRLVTEALQRQSQDNITAMVGLLSLGADPEKRTTPASS
ncbi:hypothetical protein CCYA_CCYA18G4529 [Cyanidiococcus yangmingshanensis]|nr:hypothetical protein CCYA_CCYA18G4529 [Cyanidiococcus yangmingshanensis]